MIEGVAGTLNKVATTLLPPNEMLYSFKDIVNDYFERSLLRNPTGIVSAGGSVSVATTEELNAMSFHSKLLYLVEDRFYHTWDNGARTTVTAMNNIINPGNTKPRWEDVYITEAIGIYPKFFPGQQPAAMLPAGGLSLGQFRYWPGQGTPTEHEPKIFISKSITYTDFFTGTRRTIPVTALPLEAYGGPAGADLQYMRLAAGVGGSIDTLYGFSHAGHTFDEYMKNAVASYTLYFLWPGNHSSWQGRASPQVDPQMSRWMVQSWVPLATHETSESLSMQSV